MKFLADENFPFASVEHLRKSGFDITCAGSDFSGISDSELVEIAIREERTILTFDKDYGELIFKHNKRPDCGIIFFRLVEFTPAEPGQLLELVIGSNDFDPSGALTVIDRGSVRQKKY